MNPRSFSIKYEVPEGTTRGYVDRGSVPSSEYVAKLLRSIENLNPTWLLLGDGEMFSGAPKHLPTNQRSTSGNNVVTNTGLLLQNSGTQHFATTADCEKELAAAQDKIRLLESQLTDKERIIQLLEMQLKK